MSRRDFLGRFIKIFFSLLAVVFSSAIIYIYPFRIKKKEFHYTYLMDEDDMPKRGVRRVDYKYASGDKVVTSKAYVAADGRGLTIFSPVCTHLGCLVYWDNNRKEFLCPCHEGRYDINGNVIGGPPPKPLTRLPMEIKDGKVYVGIKV